jgi:hypothetical protein
MKKEQPTKVPSATVYIHPKAHAMIMTWVNKAKGEVSGLGRVKVHPNGILEVTKVYLLKQSNTAASTELDQDEVASLLFETKDDREEYGELTFWWHSHVNMDVFWSGTDIEAIHQIGGNGYVLATVFNKRGEFKTAYYQASNGFYPSLFMDDIHTQYGYVASAEELKEWESEYDKKNIKPKFSRKSGRSAIWNPVSRTWESASHSNGNKRKGKKAKKGKQTLLTDEAIDFLAVNSIDPLENDTYIPNNVYSHWRDLAEEVYGLGANNEQVEEFYLEYQGDYNAALVAVMNTNNTHYLGV